MLCCTEGSMSLLIIAKQEEIYLLTYMYIYIWLVVYSLIQLGFSWKLVLEKETSLILVAAVDTKNTHKNFSLKIQET